MPNRFRVYQCVIMSLSNVCLIIDFDGFFVNKKFYVREMGFYSLTKNVCGSYRFKLNHLVKKLTDKDWKCIRYCSKYIHGLSFRKLPGEQDIFNLNFLTALVRIEYEQSKRQNKFLVAFKGGHVEKDLLQKMGYPYVNLENFGCPKFDFLPWPEVPDCGYHKKLKKGETVHCPQVECVAFAEWVKENL